MAGHVRIRGVARVVLLIGWGVLGQGFRLAGNMADSVPINENPALPADTNVLQGRFATLQSAFAGSSELAYQWFVDRGAGAEAILSATNASYVIGPMTTADTGDYFVRVTHVGGTMSAESRVAWVGYAADFEPPVIRVARWLDDRSILVQFDEALAVDQASGTIDTLAYAIQPSGQPPWIVGSVLPTNNNTAVILGTFIEGTTLGMREFGRSYLLIIDGDYVRDPYENFIEFRTETLVGFDLTVLPLDAVWHYNEAGVDLGPTWFTPPVDTSTPGWRSGPGVLAHETAGSVVPLIRTDLTAPTEGGPNRAYFVTRFRLPVQLHDVFDFSLSYYLDDGAIVYLNGVEIHRQRIIPGRIVPVGEAHLEGPFVITNFVDGFNELAVEVHQAGSVSEDVVWGAHVTALTIAPSPHVPHIGVQPNDVVQREGGSATFEVVADAPSPLSYQWQHNQVDLPGQTNSWLLLENLTPHDAGLYRVHVSTLDWSVWSDSAELVVQPVLAIRHLPDGNVQLSWTSDSWILLQSTSPNGSYAPVPGNTTSPLILAPTSPGLFFQLRTAP